ncbi:hypothetical protein ANN_15740 [Periplaneta americana]|uniref:DUF659 domain-containing protein n=1 Tax=Periplaneta americana TaxID=6978 RepID=A0ABQ8SH23_PERAM|nr:hypothetical protein ANN_15740 [Periplaneta americana]
MAPWRVVTSELCSKLETPPQCSFLSESVTVDAVLERVLLSLFLTNVFQSVFREVHVAHAHIDLTGRDYDMFFCLRMQRIQAHELRTDAIDLRRPQNNITGRRRIRSPCAVSSTQKFLVQQHITTSKHQANKQLNSKQRQLFLTQPTTSNVRSEFNIDLCRSLISADIPLYKLKNKVFREFLEKYTQHTIPDESTLRKTYAPSIYDETIQKIRDEIKDSSIWVSIDETPDKEGRLVGNVVIGLLSEQYSERILLHCDVLEKCNNKTIVKLFNEAMGILWPKGIMYDNVLFFISDAALIWSKLDKHYLLYILN